MENKVIISAKPITKNDEFRDYLLSKGAKVIDFPMIEICQAEVDDKIKNVFNRLKSYQWLIFTSKNGVEYFYTTLKNINIDLKILNTVKIAVVGRKTGEEVKLKGNEPFYISGGNSSEDLLEELLNKHIKPGDNILLALGELASDKLENGLKKTASVTRVDSL